MNIYLCNAPLLCVSAFLSPQHAGVMIVAMLVVAAVALFFIVRRYRAVISHADSLRSQADSADALAKAISMIDSIQSAQSTDISDNPDENI